MSVVAACGGGVMLSNDLREAVRALQGELMASGLPADRVIAVCNRLVEIEDLADRIQAWERAAVPGPAARLDAASLPEGVVLMRPEGAA